MKENKKRPKIGWARLDEETKERLNNLGIRGLDRTPGKLITAKGHIDGYLSAYGIVWGKLKMTGEQAAKAMGFKPKKGAVGVLLSSRRYVDANGKVRSGIFAVSLMPWKADATEKGKRGQERMRVLGKIASEHMKDIIYPIWQPLGKSWDGYRYFMKVNNRNVGNALDWSKFRIADGRLSSPEHICANRLKVTNDKLQIRKYNDSDDDGYKENTPSLRDTPLKEGNIGKQRMEIEIYVPRTIGRKPITINQMGIGLFDSITGSFFHISPERLAEEVDKRLKAHGIRLWEVEKAKLDSIIEPIKFVWELCYTIKSKDNEIKVPTFFQDIMRGKEKKPSVTIGGISEWGNFRRFYIYNYYKRISRPDLPNGGKQACLVAEYSASICRRVRMREEKIDGKHSVPIIITIVERA